LSEVVLIKHADFKRQQKKNMQTSKGNKRRTCRLQKATKEEHADFKRQQKKNTGPNGATTALIRFNEVAVSLSNVNEETRYNLRRLCPISC